MSHVFVEESPVSWFLFSSTRASWFWLLVRVYVGWEWLHAGLGKITSPLWTGPDAGSPVVGFVNRALTKMSGEHPDVAGWYGWFLSHAVLPHATAWSNVVAYGEFFVGIALILGLFTGIAAFFGLFMNANYLFAGTVSSNPILFVLGIGIVLAWKVAGYIGLDRFVLPFVGTPWSKVYKS